MLTSHNVSSLVVDRLCDRARGQNTTVTYFYFDFAACKEQSVTSILGSLLRQIIGGMETVPQEILRAFQEQRKAGARGPQLPDIVKMLQTITSSLRTFICIDAIDECAAVHRVKLLNSLQQILETSLHTRIFIIGRPHVRAEIEKRLAGRVISVSVIPSKDDIVEYLRLRLDEDENPDAMDASLEADILEKIPETMSEMYVDNNTGNPPTLSANRYASRFLLVSLNIDAILHESTISRRREKLSRMPNGSELGDVYGATVERIKAQGGDKSRLGMTALMWVSHAERPLQVDELCHALAVQLDSRDFDFGNIPSVSTLVSCCQGLITVDNEASTVRLIHFTLQEYISVHPDMFSRPHSAIAEICLTYLNSQQAKAPSTAPSSDTQNIPFLEYCSVYWGVHARKELSNYARSLAIELLQENYGQISTKLLLAQVKHPYLGDSDTCSPFSGLHCASFFGTVEVVAALIEMQCYDINEGDFLGCTPLAWAARNGHEEAVKILLEREEVNPVKPDNYGRTPLYRAASNGHEEVVKILLEREEVNPDNPDNRGQTPLSSASWNGHEGVVKILLGREEVNPDKPDTNGQTPLFGAARDGHEGVVKILLGQEEVNPDKPDTNGQTPLFGAARYGHEGVMKILLGREEVNPNKPDTNGQTPLFGAARYGHEGVVELLLGREDINPNKPDTRGQTPLYCAAWTGHEGVVKILLGHDDVNPEKPDVYGQTPLFSAASNGHEGVVEVLLGRDDVNPDNPNKYGQTPLFGAAWDGHEGVVEILLRHDNVNPDKPDILGRTPLWWATKSGHAEVVALLQPLVSTTSSTS